MLNVTGVVKGFTFHAYPGQQGANLSSLLLNTTWLREGILTGTEAYLCLDYWNSGPRAAGMDLWITESSSSWNWQLPPPAQNSFLHGFFTLPELGQCVWAREAPAAAHHRWCRMGASAMPTTMRLTAPACACVCAWLCVRGCVRAGTPRRASASSRGGAGARVRRLAPSS